MIVHLDADTTRICAIALEARPVRRGLQLSLNREQFVQAFDLFGERNVSRPDGAPICRLTFTDEAAGEWLYWLRLQPDCVPALRRIEPVAWKFKRDDNVLHDRNGDVLRFECGAGGMRTKIPDKPQSLRLSRP